MSIFALTLIFLTTLLSSNLSFGADKHAFTNFMPFSGINYGFVSSSVANEPPSGETPTYEESSAEASYSQFYVKMYGEGYNEDDFSPWLMYDFTGLTDYLMSYLGVKMFTQGDIEYSGDSVVTNPSGSFTPAAGKIWEIFRSQIGWKMFNMFNHPIGWFIDFGALQYPGVGNKGGHIGAGIHYIIALNQDFRIRPNLALNAIIGGGMWDYGVSASYDFMKYFGSYVGFRGIGVQFKDDNDIVNTIYEHGFQAGLTITFR